jgi:ABC-type multidrug transport system fused ATPase/permease subunit
VADVPSAKLTVNEMTVKSAVGVLIRGHRVQVAMMALSSVIGGFTEAVFLVVVTRTAFAITDGKHEMGLLANHRVAVSTALLICVLLVLFRIASAITSNWYSSKLTSEVTAELRQRLAQAFLRSTWSAQHTSPAGRLQHLVTGFANAGTSLISAFTGGVVAACSVGAMLLLAVGVDPVGSLLAVAAVGTLGSVLRPVRRRVHSAARRSTNDSMLLATTASEVSGLGMVVHVFDVRPQVEDRVTGVLEKGRRSSQRLDLVRGFDKLA